MALLKLASQNYNDQIRDYTCLFLKREVVEGKLTEEQHIEVKFREAPFTVYMKWVKNPGLVDRVLYAKGQYGDQALIKPAGFLALFVPTHVKRPVNSPDSAKVSRRRIDEFGFANLLKMVEEVNLEAQKAGELSFEYKGEDVVDGRKTFVFERHLPDKPQYPDQRMVLQLDQEWILPVAATCYGPDNRLLGHYEYRKVKLNPSLGWKEFTPKANGL